MIAILAYHSLDDTNSVLSTSPRVFAEQMRILHELNLEVLPLGDVPRRSWDHLRRESAVVITFDDGFSSVYQHAVPILQNYGFPATVFLVTDFCEKTNGWLGQPLSIKHQPLLRWSEVQELSQTGVSFGSHTRTHPDLRTLPQHEAEAELMSSKAIIEDITGRPVDTLAYPYGAYDKTVIGLAQEHYQLACSTTLDFVTAESDPLALERIDMYYLRSPAVFGRLFSPAVGVYLDLRRYLRNLRRTALPFFDPMACRSLGTPN